MYGSIFRMKLKPGQEQRMVDLFDEWDRDRRPKVKGAITGFILKPDNKPGELVGAGIFEDKEAYMANAADPEQHQWFLKLRELLEADPEWEDGEFIAGSFE